MKAVTVSGMRSIEDAAIRDGRTEEQLMEQAGERLAHAIARYYPQPGTIVAYLGKGHNAGDALVALRHLRDRFSWQVAIRSAFPEEIWAPLTRVKHHQLGTANHFPSTPPWQTLPRPIILLDALLGIGAKGPLRDPLLPLAAEMAWLRENIGAKIAALDIPSGTDPDTGEIHPGSVIADATFMIGAPKIGLLHQHAANATGNLHLVTVDGLSSTGGDGFHLTLPASLKAASQLRPFDFHKGTAGRVGILAGSREYTGAAILAATGALRAGAGLVTLHVPADAFELITAKAPPEAIVRPCTDPLEILTLRYDSLVIGCGLHSTDESFRTGILDLISRTEIPSVIDAEALNLISTSGDIGILHANHILTPHPGEFARLAPDLAAIPREQAARDFSNRTHATLLLKGSRTVVASPGQPLRFNPTGTPGMATGGQGDLLSGVIGALLAIGNPPPVAAAIAAWLCGRAAELALLSPDASEQSLLPTDVLRHLGGAFNDWSGQGR